MTSVDDPRRHVVAVTGFVQDGDGRVLLARVASRSWELPGGQVEPGEDVVRAVVREVAEETSCIVDVSRLVGVYSRLTPPQMLLLLFACRHLGGEAKALEEAVPEVGWFSPTRARELVTHPPSARRLADALSAGDQVVYRAYRASPYELVGERAL